MATLELDKHVQYAYEVLKGGKLTFGDIVYLIADLTEKVPQKEIHDVVQNALIRLDYSNGLSLDDRYVLSFRLRNASEFLKEGLPAVVDILTKKKSMDS